MNMAPTRWQKPFEINIKRMEFGADVILGIFCLTYKLSYISCLKTSLKASLRVMIHMKYSRVFLLNTFSWLTCFNLYLVSTTISKSSVILILIIITIILKTYISVYFDYTFNYVNTWYIHGAKAEIGSEHMQLPVEPTLNLSV